MTQDQLEVERILSANNSFYEAFGSLNIDKMEQVWETSEDVRCIHPNSSIIRGWVGVRQSWADIFYNTTLMHFNITDEEVSVRGDSAWVSCQENISTVVNARAANFTVQATNIYVRNGDGEWKLVHHHGSG